MATPTTSPLESLPTAWSPADDTFFRVVASVFPPDFTFGAGSLLASYDEELPVVPQTTAAPPAPAPTVAVPSVARVAA